MPRVNSPRPFSVPAHEPAPQNHASAFRLPAYRASHMHRFHPYPRVTPARCQDRLMSTVDYRFGQEPIWEEPADEDSWTTGSQDDAHGEGVPKLSTPHRADVDADVVTREGEGQPGGAPKPSLSRAKVATAVADALAGLRRRYLALLAVRVRTILKPGPERDIKRA
ncbi:hypothetical protein BD413DRAFT_489226 [Trametes elegans]|nr:hypothetical protein BD413DRAFT_489226 [Trametes elegans]